MRDPVITDEIRQDNMRQAQEVLFEQARAQAIMEFGLGELDDQIMPARSAE